MDTSVNDADAPLLVYENIDTFDIFKSSFKIDKNFKLAFNEKVIPGNGDIVISNGTDTRVVAIDDSNQVTFDESGGVIIDLAEDLVADTTYNVQMASGVITDTAGNAFTGFDITGKKTETSEPLFKFSNIHSGGSTFKIDSKIGLNFDEKVIAGSGDIIISNGVDTLTIPITDTNQVIFDKSESDEFGGVIIDPINDLIVDTTYSVQIDNGVITDAAGNPFAGLINPFSGLSDFNITTIGPEPLLKNSIPRNESIFKIGDKIRLTFDEQVKAGSGDIIFSNGTDTRIIAIDDTSQVTFDELGGVVIDLAEDLIADTTYSAQMASGVIIDTEGNAYAGFSNAIFKSIASVPLVVGIGTTINEMVFDEHVIAGSGDIIINGFNANEVSARKVTAAIPVTDTNQVIFNNSNRGEEGSVVIKPHSLFPFDIVQIDSGVITDTEGNAYAGFTLNTTAITSDPMLLASIPANGSVIKIDDTMRLIFNEKVIVGSGDIIFSNGTDTRIIAIDDTSQVTFDELGGVVIDLAEDLIADTTYNVQMASGVITDTIGNNYTGFSDAKISTIDSDPLPLARSFAFKNDGKISFYFDEKVKAGSGDIIFNNSTDTRIVAIDDISQVTFDEFGGVFIDLAEDLTADTTYNVQMASGVITDTADNVYAGFSNLTIGTFASNPLLTSARPGNRIELIFDEQVLPGDGDVTISNGTDTRIIAIDDTSQVTFDEFGGVIVDPSADLSKNTVYSMRIESEAIMDTDGNPYVGSSASSNLIPIFEHISYEPIFGEGHNSATSWLF